MVRGGAGLREPERSDGLAQRRDLEVGSLLPRLELLSGAVDPHDRDLPSKARLDVMVIAGSDVDPASLAADAPLALLEVRGVRLVGADLLGGHDEVEVVRYVPAREAEELVVDVRDQAEGESLLDQSLQHRVGLSE